MMEDTDPESWLSREVYANFGLAMYCAQVLEHGIVNLAVWAGLRDGTITGREDMEADYIALFECTMGQLNTTLRSRRPDYSDVEDGLRRALALRSFLAHRYFRERSAAFMTEDGRRHMIAELEKARDFLIEVDSKLGPLTAEILRLMGVDKHIPEVLAHPEQDGFGEPLPAIT
jgi:hypothetical protein